MWSDRDILKAVDLPGTYGLISPFDIGQVNPASYDVRLAAGIRVPAEWDEDWEVDCDEVRSGYTREELIPQSGHVLEPGAFILASTIETVQLPLRIWARIEGKSSLGRIGLAVHITAGFIDPGFHGQITLEIANLLGRPIRLRPGMRIAQIAFGEMHTLPLESYAAHGHYQGQAGPVESRYRM